MPVTNNKVTSPIGLKAVANLLGVTSDLASVCTANSINKWSRNKPVGITSYNKIAHTTFTDSVSQNTESIPFGGIYVKECSAVGLPDSSGTYSDYARAVVEAVDAGWQYAKPVIGTDWMRLTDFNNYYQDAFTPISYIDGISDKKLSWDCKSTKAISATGMTYTGPADGITLSDFATLEPDKTIYLALAIGDEAMEGENIDNTHSNINSISHLILATDSLINMGKVFLVPQSEYNALKGNSYRAFLVAIALNDHQISSLGTKLTSSALITPYDIDTGSTVDIYPLPLDDKSKAWFLFAISSSLAPSAFAQMGIVSRESFSIRVGVDNTANDEAVVVSVTATIAKHSVTKTTNILPGMGTITIPKHVSFSFSEDFLMMPIQGATYDVKFSVSSRFISDPEDVAVQGTGGTATITIP